MKTVGIITVHHYGNFGSALQAYASQKVFERLGYDTYIIDYRSPSAYYATNRYMDYEDRDDSFYHKLEKHSSCVLKRVARKVLNNPYIARLLYEMGMRRGIRLTNFWLENLRMTRRYDRLSDLYADPPHFDIYVVGGDQLWNTHITFNNPAFFLTFADKGAKKITFSTSIGIPAIPAEALNTFKKGINNLSAILLREQEGVDYLRSLGYKADRVFDPTLMLTKEEWSSMQNKKYKLPYKKYILAYFLDPTDWTTELLGTVRQQTGLPVIVIGPKKKGHANTGCFYTGNIEVSTFLTLFAHAEIVVTNSFHGMAFTIVFQKIMVATYRSDESETSMNSRHRNMVDLFGLSACLYDRKSFSPEKLSYRMNYKKINEYLEVYRKQSLELLKKALG